MRSTSGLLHSAGTLILACVLAVACGSPGETADEEMVRLDGIPTVRLDDIPEVSEGEDAPSAENIALAEMRVRASFPLGEPLLDDSSAAATLAAYAHLDPGKVIPPELLKKALAYFDAHKAKIPNRRYVSVIDYGMPSSKPRFFVVDMTSGAVQILRVAHGKGSDPDHDGLADSFGNVPNSGKTSLGYVLTAETYVGKHGRSLRLDGLSATNSNMRRRAVVIHGSKYVHDAEVIQGRSLGCPAVPMKQTKSLIDALRGGSLIFAASSR